MSTAPVSQNTPAAAAAPPPDPVRGVFETLLVASGAPVELEAHLERLAASLATLYGAEPPSGLAAAVRERCRGFELARLRLVLAPAAGDAESAESRPGPGAQAADPRWRVDPGGQAADPRWRVDFVVQAVAAEEVFPSRERAAELLTLSCEGGLGRHKWADRRPLEGVLAPAVPLLLDAEEVLEAGRANVFAVRDGVLFTPADDGRILPGIARAGAIAAAREAGIEVREGPLARRDLHAADEAFLTGSVRGVEPAATLDGAPLPATAAVSQRVAAGLRRRWLAAPSLP